MKNKNFLNKLPIKPVDIETEKKLLPRLKCMAYILFAFSAGIFAFALLAPKESALNELERPSLASGIALEVDDTPLELDPREVLNFFTVSALFAGAGSLLLFITWKKGKMFTDLDQE